MTIIFFHFKKLQFSIDYSKNIILARINPKDSIEWKILRIYIKILLKGDKMKLPLNWMNFSDRVFITTKWHLLNVINIEKKILKMFKSRF